MTKTLSQILVDLDFHTEAAAWCLSQAQWFEKKGDLATAEDAHADTAFHLQKAEECRALAKRMSAGLFTTAAA